MSFPQPTWRVRPFDLQLEPVKNQIQKKFDLHPLIAQLLVQRGFTKDSQVSLFLHGTLADLPNPFHLPDMDRAVDRLIGAVHKREKIVFFGDYDVDGITGTAQLQAYFREIGADTEALLPHRLRDGYGLTESAVRKIAAIKPNLLVTIDNGTKARDEIKFLRGHGIEVIVIDHHETPSVEGRPDVTALVNPKSEDSRFGERDIASAGLVFLLLMALRARSRERGFAPLPNLKRFLDLACLGTIADVVPLTGVNRLLVRHGLEEIGNPQRPGLQALCANAGVSSSVDAGAVAFRLAPRLNAAGRLADPRIALDLLLAQTDSEASALASTLESLNRERQSIEETVVREAIAQIEQNHPDRNGLVAFQKGWHLGVVGIVAAKLTEKFGRPAVVLSISEDGSEARGSARSVSGFSVYEPLKRMEGEMVRFGGHAAAAGMTVDGKNLDRFAERFNEEVGVLWQEYHRPALLADAVLGLREITSPFVKNLLLLEPHGAGNPEPVFLAETVKLEGCRVVGRGAKGHLKAVLSDGGMRLEGIGFNQGSYLQTALTIPLHLIAYAPQFNEWNGIQSIQLKIKSIQPLCN